MNAAERERIEWPEPRDEHAEEPTEPWARLADKLQEERPGVPREDPRWRSWWPWR